MSLISFQDEERDKLIDSQRPGLRISTFFRQLLFDLLYVVEFLILITFGLLAEVKEFKEYENIVFIAVIISLWEFATFLRVLYYNTLHVWSNIIRVGKKPIRKEMELESNRHSDTIHKNFFQYVFLSRNTWMFGSLKHIQTTLIILPKTIIDGIAGQGKDVKTEFRDTLDKSTKWSKFTCTLFVFLSFILTALFIGLLLLSIPILLVLFLWNLIDRNGFKVISADGKFLEKYFLFRNCSSIYLLDTEKANLLRQDTMTTSDEINQATSDNCSNPTEENVDNVGNEILDIPLDDTDSSTQVIQKNLSEKYAKIWKGKTANKINRSTSKKSHDEQQMIDASYFDPTITGFKIVTS